jgi:hypothetical protein
MSDDSDRTFIAGVPNPEKYGWSIRACNGTQSNPEQIARAAQLLGREAFFTDDLGYECEIIAAAVHSDDQRMVYVESRAKEGTQFVDIAIKIHYVDASGCNNQVDIESYNPFFGCDVGLIEWFDDETAILVYREKHWTFIYHIVDDWPPKFVKIEDRWQIQSNVLSYRAYRDDTVHRLELPSLSPIPEITIAEAQKLGQLPPDPY